MIVTMRVLLAVFSLVVSCNYYPVEIKIPEPEVRIEALKFVDREFASMGYVPVGGFARFVWVNASHVALDESIPKVEMGEVGRGYCWIFVSARKPSESAFAHGAAHCASAQHGDPDPDHTGFIWQEIPRINMGLAQRGM
jgi:hypothetical protein